MTTDIHQPHDSLFQQAMKNIAVARDFFESHLPESLLQRIDLVQLQLEHKSFIDDRSRRSESDMVYSIKLDDSAAIYFYLLCEHQSRVDPDMPYRLLRYQLRLMEQHRNQYPKSDLPIIYPMVLYSGKTPWNKSRSLFDYYGEYGDLAKSLWGAPFQLIDLHRMEDDELQKHQLSGLMEFALKNRKTHDFRKFLKRFLPWLDQVNIEDSNGFVKIMLRYVLLDVDKSEAKIFDQVAVEHLSETTRREAMNLAQQYEARGMKKGLQKGLENGRVNGLKEVAVRLLAKGLSVEVVVELTALDLEAVLALQETLA